MVYIPLMTKKEVVVVAQLLRCVQLFSAPWTLAHQASLSFTISWSLLKLMSIESVMPYNRFILCHPLLLLSIFLNIRVFSNELALYIRWPKYWSFSISPFNNYSWLISFRIDCFDLFAVQRTLKSLLQNHSLKNWKHLFFSPQSSLWSKSDILMSTGKTIALTTRTFVSKVMSLLFNMLFRFVIGNPLQYSCLENHMDGGAC